MNITTKHDIGDVVGFNAFGKPSLYVTGEISAIKVRAVKSAQKVEYTVVVDGEEWCVYEESCKSV